MEDEMSLERRPDEDDFFRGAQALSEPKAITNLEPAAGDDHCEKLAVPVSSFQPKITLSIMF
jgi:hypothetical protein